MVKDRFKFRVWDKRLNRYLGKNDPMQMLLENGNLAYLDDEGMKFYEVEFCTGLKDKNGKLIYEGDIVRCSYGSEYYVGCVVWDYEEIQFSMEVSEELYSFSQHSDSHKIEIIGNIHENPDLIES